MSGRFGDCYIEIWEVDGKDGDRLQIAYTERERQLGMIKMKRDSIAEDYNCTLVRLLRTDIYGKEADLVEVVRCKDCKHNPKRTNDLAYGRCVGCCEDDWYGYVPDDDFFCGYGER